jgi:hypothetical protein
VLDAVFPELRVPPELFESSNPGLRRQLEATEVSATPSAALCEVAGVTQAELDEIRDAIWAICKQFDKPVRVDQDAPAFEWRYAVARLQGFSHEALLEACVELSIFSEGRLGNLLDCVDAGADIFEIFELFAAAGEINWALFDYSSHRRAGFLHKEAMAALYDEGGALALGPRVFGVDFTVPVSTPAHAPLRRICEDAYRSRNPARALCALASVTEDEFREIRERLPQWDSLRKDDHFLWEYAWHYAVARLEGFSHSELLAATDWVCAASDGALGIYLHCLGAGATPEELVPLLSSHWTTRWTYLDLRCYGLPECPGVSHLAALGFLSAVTEPGAPVSEAAKDAAEALAIYPEGESFIMARYGDWQGTPYELVVAAREACERRGGVA